MAGALRYIREGFDRPPQVTDIALELAVSRSTLERTFKMHLDDTIHGPVVRARLENVRRLLVETDEPPKNVAELSGLSSPEHLCLSFRKYVGMTPEQYRQRG